MKALAGPLTRVPGSRFALLAGAIVVQLVVLYAPNSPGGPSVPHLDKLVHALVFGAVALAALRAKLAAAWVIGLLLVHAVVSEVAQEQLLAGRAGDARDTVADAVGTLLGAGLAARWKAGRST